jgi:hypothetical protein
MQRADHHAGRTPSRRSSADFGMGSAKRGADEKIGCRAGAGVKEGWRDPACGNSVGYGFNPISFAKPKLAILSLYSPALL